jgi:hypothetical protein
MRMVHSQVATHDRVLLFDLYSLGLDSRSGALITHNLELLNDTLRPVLLSSNCLKVETWRWRRMYTCVIHSKDWYDYKGTSILPSWF